MYRVFHFICDATSLFFNEFNWINLHQNYHYCRLIFISEMVYILHSRHGLSLTHAQAHAHTNQIKGPCFFFHVKWHGIHSCRVVCVYVGVLLISLLLSKNCRLRQFHRFEGNSNEKKVVGRIFVIEIRMKSKYRRNRGWVWVWVTACAERVHVVADTTCLHISILSVCN